MFILKDSVDNTFLFLLLSVGLTLQGRLSMDFMMFCQTFLEFVIVGEVSKGLSDGFGGLVESALMICEFDGAPEGVQFGVVVGGSCVVEGECSGESVKFFELLVAVVDHIFSVDLSEEFRVFFNFGDFFMDGGFATDLFNLFFLEVGFALKISNFSQFFVEVPDLLLQGPEVRLVLLIYSLELGLACLAFLWLLFFLHQFKIIN